MAANAFAQDFRKIALPALKSRCAEAARGIHFRQISFTVACSYVLAQARRFGSSALSADLNLELDDWICRQILREIDLLEVPADASDYILGCLSCSG